MAKLIRARLRSSSVLESIIALSIMMIAFSIGITVFAKFVYPMIDVRKEKARQILKQQFLKIRTEHYFRETDTTVNGLHILIRIQPYNSALIHVIGTVVDEGQHELIKEDALNLIH